MIEVESVDGVALLRMRHGRANALDIELCEALTARFADLRDNAAEAIVLTGNGAIFSAGVDLKRLVAGGADYVRVFLPALHRLYEEIYFHPKPVVAAINGHAVAGGAILACCADRRIMGHEVGRIGVTELLVGVPFPALAFEILRASVPAEYLAEFAYSGATYMTDDALECGWVDEIAEPEELLEDAVAVARELASIAPAAFAETKGQMRAPVADRYRSSGEATDEAVTALWCADDTLARVRGYVAQHLTK
jgi:enoyl-CoA hydratase